MLPNERLLWTSFPYVIWETKNGEWAIGFYDATSTVDNCTSFIWASKPYDTVDEASRRLNSEPPRGAGTVLHYALTPPHTIQRLNNLPIATFAPPKR